MDLTLIGNGIEKKVDRQDIVDFEMLLRSHPQAQEGDSMPLEHYFTNGIYVRQITIPKGTILVGKIHKHEHPNFLLKGTVQVATEEGVKTLEAPCFMISPSGTKRAVTALTEVVWTTIHHNPSNTQDLVKLEDEIIAKSYDEYDNFIANKLKPTFYQRCINFVKQLKLKNK